MDSPSLDAQLDALLSEDLQSVIRREQTAFDALTAPLGDSLILFGAGSLGRRTLAGLRRLSMEPLAFADNNTQLWGQAVDGLQVLPPTLAVETFGSKATFVVTICSDVAGHPLEQVAAQLNAYGPARVVSFAFLYWKYPEAFLPYFSLDLPHKLWDQMAPVRAASHLWADPASQQEYLAQIRWRLWLDFASLPMPGIFKHYFPDDLFALRQDEIFVDGGAFDGDTTREFLLRRGTSFRRLIAFEPDPINFRRLESYTSTLDEGVRSRLVMLQKAIGARREKVLFESQGTLQSSISQDGNIEVECIPLGEIPGVEAPTYVKLDIEGSEFEALVGAQQIIRETTPVLAVSVYHQFDHLWKLPLFIRSLSDRYRLFLRPHGQAWWDLVCYAIPEARLLKPEA